MKYRYYWNEYYGGNLNVDNSVKGAWLIYQVAKLDKVTETSAFDNTVIAGKCGVLLSAITQDNQAVVDNSRLDALAKAAGIKKIEIQEILRKLKDQGLIDIGKSGVDILGVTSKSCLQHTANIFDSLNPTSLEDAAIELCEEASMQPKTVKAMSEMLSDKYRIAHDDTKMLFDLSLECGFVEREIIDGEKDLLFNGNLFKRDNIRKINAVLTSLSHGEAGKLTEMNQYLDNNACVPIQEAKKILGEDLFNKLSSVGIFDISIVSNSKEEVAYITKPAAFSKYSMVDDAFDLAKMFVSSLTYGMTRSTYQRGQIRMIEALMTNLINGMPVGPVNAIGEDYKVLELKNVIQVYNGSKNGRNGYIMKLLKREVGVLALEVIKNADVSSHSLTELPSAAINRFKGPEVNRSILRKKEVGMHPKATNDIIMSLRTGGIY